MQAMVDGAPRLLDYLGDESLAHFEACRRCCAAAGIAYTVNPRLVRGLDYYNLTVFEWVTDRLGAQGTVCGGGRYDGLFEQLGGKPTPALRFCHGRGATAAADRGARTIDARRAARRLRRAPGRGRRCTHAMRLAETMRDARPGRGARTAAAAASSRR